MVVIWWRNLNLHFASKLAFHRFAWLMLFHYKPCLDYDYVSFIGSIGTLDFGFWAFRFFLIAWRRWTCCCLNLRLCPEFPMILFDCCWFVCLWCWLHEGYAVCHAMWSILFETYGLMMNMKCPVVYELFWTCPEICLISVWFTVVWLLYEQHYQCHAACMLVFECCFDVDYMMLFCHAVKP